MSINHDSSPEVPRAPVAQWFELNPALLESARNMVAESTKVDKEQVEIWPHALLYPPNSAKAAEGLGSLMAGVVSRDRRTFHRLAVCETALPSPDGSTEPWPVHYFMSNGPDMRTPMEMQEGVSRLVSETNARLKELESPLTLPE